MAADKAPDAYRTISEAAAETGLKAHVLRFWESKFAQLKPVKQKGGRRHYRPQDIALIRGLRVLLHDEGLTIKGAQKYLRDHGVAEVAAIGRGGVKPAPEPGIASRSNPAARPEPAPGRTPPAQPGSHDELVERLEQAKARLDAVLAGS
ncbi:MAG: MerR family transcriptional regulator [Pseudomonadota bacterium]